MDGSASLGQAAPSDYYELLRVPFTADAAQLKAAFRQLQRLAHPDVAGEGASSASSLLNSAYETLSDPARRAVYDAELKQHRQHTQTFTGQPVSAWHGSADDSTAILVDETSCIGCAEQLCLLYKLSDVSPPALLPLCCTLVCKGTCR